MKVQLHASPWHPRYTDVDLEIGPAILKINGFVRDISDVHWYLGKELFACQFVYGSEILLLSFRVYNTAIAKDIAIR